MIRPLAHLLTAVIKNVTTIGGKVYNHIIIISDREIDNDSESN